MSPDHFPGLSSENETINDQPESADWFAVLKTKISNSRDNYSGISDVNSSDMRSLTR